ncbi:cupin domain-containing protein [Candidatus Aalborgicola defluviihabitans]|uniref:cupin domain-containing protein n=1 Tax=Candidatus Aalborgicola defluviihabitans TaxID=3386187 RepID=UPI001D59EAD2|nr:cupin domain-containing protein [Burkholderiales bacterium]MBK6567931.1 cupin domain-containing protein [Burkholderiales bacterium]MBK7280551.1 cupin domain-containing protein [Burkholderiales bacterium]MBK7313310.1 cupin domain-containing protein [Burkholderiales bacterium]MBL0244585.1 cupin domain-containing protein [Rhodoferax sp.]
MAIQHAVSGQPVGVMPIANTLGERQAVAIFKTNELEVMRLVLPKGKTMPAHKVAGDITVQCLDGSIRFVSDDSTQVLVAGEMLYLAGGVPHSLTGIEDALALVHIVLRH